MRHPGKNRSQRNLRGQLATVYDFESWVRQLGRASGSGSDPYRVFRRTLDEIRFDLLAIENERGYEIDLDPANAMRRLQDRQRDLRNSVIELPRLHAEVARRVMLRCEVEQWTAAAAIVCTDSTPIDPQHDDPDEISTMRALIETWDTVAAVMRAMTVQLRAAVGCPPNKEIEIQKIAETLLIGNDVRVVREREITTRDLERRRPDLQVAQLGLTIEIKIVTSPEAVGRVADEIRADTSFGDDYRRLIFVIYDCGYIRRPDDYARQLESYFQSNPTRSATVLIVH